MFQEVAHGVAELVLHAPKPTDGFGTGDWYMQGVMQACNTTGQTYRGTTYCHGWCLGRDFSTPQPKIPIIFRPFVALLHIAPNLIGLIPFVGALYLALYTVAHNTRFLQGLVCLLFLAFVRAFFWKLLPG